MMRKIRLFIAIIALFTSFVSQSQNIHSAKIMGVISIGQKDVAIINDLTTGEVFKTTAYYQGLLITDENIQLDFPNSGNENKAKVVKANLTKIIFCFNENNPNACDDLCIKHYGNNMLVVRYTKNNFRIIYRARTNNGITNSNVRIFKKKPDGIRKIISTSFIVDTNITSYKLNLHEDIITKANNLKNTLPEGAWKRLSIVYENFLNKLNSVSPATFKSDLGQSSAFHLSIYNTVKRSLVNNTDCGCLPSPYYFIGKTPFMCQKDFVFDVAKVLNTLNKNIDKIKNRYDDETILILTNYFKKQTKPEITLDEFYFETSGISPNDFEESLNSFCILGPASTLGCCGAGDGCCWGYSSLCLLHDLACGYSGCEPRELCFDGCVPF